MTASPAAAYTGKQTPVQTPAQTPAGAPVALSLDQRRAAFALACVQQVDSAFPLPANGDEDDAKRSVARGYRAYSRNLPSTIIVNGLGQAIALELAQSARNQKDSEGHGLLLDHVTAWLVAKGGWGVSSPYHGGAKADRKGQYRKPELIAAIVSGSDFDLVRAQIETMAFLKWLKTFAEALIESRDPKGNEDADTTGTLEDAP
ncbi:MAG: type III-B CRISPR module-associated protein Cmr5 [Rhizobiaceae bacterium]|nr:type III-B CRISPR module-associated protein Cmr5 [Rhizobiaceae bacterium]